MNRIKHRPSPIRSSSHLRTTCPPLPPEKCADTRYALSAHWPPLSEQGVVPSECLTARIWGQERITWEWFLHIWILNFNSTYFPPCQISRSKLLTETCVKFFNVLQKIEASKMSSQKKVSPELGPPARASSARGLTVRMRWQARAELVWTHLSTRLAEPFPTMGVVRRISKNFAR